MAHDVPMAVLSDTLKDALRSRRVRAGLFTTFSFEPDFFEDDVLPILFDQAFSQAPKIRRVQLEENLRTVEEIAVYYDPRALIASGTASLDVRRVPVRRDTGCFHPKIAVLLVENREEDEDTVRTWESVVVMVASANLTRAGWWENVEVAQVLEITDGEASLTGKDLLAFLNVLRNADRTGGGHLALDRIVTFLRHRISAPARASKARTLHSRIWFGQKPLPEFVGAVLAPAADTYTLEVLSPYFDERPDAATLAALVEGLAPRETRVLLPVHPDGRAACDPDFHAAVASLPRVRWSRLPGEVTRRSRSKGERQADRNVHAKVYRLWSQVEGREYVLVGSPNLTSAAHGKTSAGNLEAAFLMDLGPDRRPTAWLTPLSESEQPTAFGKPLLEEGESATVPPLMVRHLWAQKRSEYFWDGESEPRQIALSNHGVPLATIAHVARSRWAPLPEGASAALAALLRSTSYLQASVDDGPTVTLLVQEEEMAHAPSLLLSLTVEEILRYWALLSREQQESFVEGKLTRELVAAGVISAAEAARLDERWRQSEGESLFDTFAGIFHAFTRLEDAVRKALENDLPRDAEYRLLGEKYDSLPVLIRKVLDDHDGDPITRYVTMLTARQLVDRLQRDHGEFFKTPAAKAIDLPTLVRRSDEVRAAVKLGDDSDAERFLTWFEQHFLAEARKAAQP